MKVGLTDIVLVHKDAEKIVWQCTRCGVSWPQYEGGDNEHECPSPDAEEFAWLNQ